MLTVKLEGLERAMGMFEERIVGRAASLAINETVRGVRTATGKEIRQEWNIKAGDLNRKLRAIKMARFGEPQNRGLGDTIAKITHATGLDRLANLYTRATGKDCGCKRRQAKLNAIFPYRR